MKYRLNTQVSAILDTAREEAREMGNNYVGSEHLLLAILKDTATPLSRPILSSMTLNFPSFLVI